ncbi:hypothetical protein GCM10023238_05970 [Streptomyces heliomycini]
MQHIIDDLQVLAAADAGSLRLNPRTLSLRELAEQSVSAHQTAARAAESHWPATSRTTSPSRATPSACARYWANLLSNAIRHTPPNGSVTVSAHQVEGGVDLHVADTGSGIQPTICPGYSTASGGPNNHAAGIPGGSGLGLSIVRHLVHAHGGEVSVASRPGTRNRVHGPAAGLIIRRGPSPRMSDRIIPRASGQGRPFSGAGGART